MKNEKTYCISCTAKDAIEIFKNDTICNYYQIEINGKTKQLIGCCLYKIGGILDIYTQKGRFLGTVTIKERYKEVKKIASYIEK